MGGLDQLKAGRKRLERASRWENMETYDWHSGVAWQSAMQAPMLVMAGLVTKGAGGLVDGPDGAAPQASPRRSRGPL